MEPKFPGRHLPIQLEHGNAEPRRGAERILVEHFDHRAKQGAIVSHCRPVAPQPHANARRHRSLHVRIARHGRATIALDPSRQNGIKCLEARIDGGERFPLVQPHGDEDLIVAGPAKVELLSRLADGLRQVALDRGVAVLVAFLEGKLTLLVQGKDLFEPRDQRFGFLPLQHPDGLQHMGVGDRGMGIEADQPLIEQAIFVGGKSLDLIVGRQS